MKFLWAPWRIRFILENKQTIARGASDCILCNLPKENSDVENYILGRSKHTYIILNKYPYNSGHMMVVPSQHTSGFSQLSEDEMLDIHLRIRDVVEVLEKELHCQGHNIGMNMGTAGGAGIPDHLHYHIVPRWNGDTNFMPVFNETRVLPESLDETYKRLAPSIQDRLE